jgi:hypothetical protein
MKNYQILLTAIVSFGVAFTILNGTAQRYVTFAGIENELGCATIALTMGVLSTYAIDWKGLLNYLNK